MPDCGNLRRRGIPCVHCNGGPTSASPITQMPTAAPAAVAESTANSGDDTGDLLLIVLLVAVVALLCVGAIVAFKGQSDREGATSTRPAGVDNALYERPPPATDGFGFGSGPDDTTGYMEVGGTAVT